LDVDNLVDEYDFEEEFKAMDEEIDKEAKAQNKDKEAAKEEVKIVKYTEGKLNVCSVAKEFWKGKLECFTKIPTGPFSPGDDVTISVEIFNSAKVKVKKIRVWVLSVSKVKGKRDKTKGKVVEVRVPSKTEAYWAKDISYHLERTLKTIEENTAQLVCTELVFGRFHKNVHFAMNLLVSRYK